MIYPVHTDVCFRLSQYKFKCFIYPTSLSCVLHIIDICTVAIKNIRKKHAVSTNQVADIFHFNDNATYQAQTSKKLTLYIALKKLKFKVALMLEAFERYFL